MKLKTACVQLKTKIYAKEEIFQDDIFNLTEKASKQGCSL